MMISSDRGTSRISGASFQAQPEKLQAPNPVISPDSSSGVFLSTPKTIRVPVELAESHPGIIDRVLDTLYGKPLPLPTESKTLWGKYQNLSIRKDGKVMRPFRG